MLKKKNIAMVMAAATVATSVAPVFAAVNEENVNEATLVAKVEKLLATKYSNSEETGITGEVIGTNEEYKNSVYSIESSKALNGSNKVDSVKTLKQMIEQLKLDDADTELVLTVTDKGHKEIDGKIVANENTAKKLYLDFTNEGAPTGATIEATLANIGATIKTDVPNGYAKITLKNGKEIELAKGDYAFDLAKPVDSNGNLIEVPSAGLSMDKPEELAIAKRISGFEIFEADTKTKQDIASKIVSKLTFDTKAVNTIEKKASDILTKDGYTKEGAKFVNSIIDAKDANNTAIIDGVRYKVVDPKVGAVTAVKGGGYELNITLKSYKASEAEPKHDNVKITIAGDVQKDLATIKAALEGADKVVDVEKKVNKLVGESRFETAAEISKATYLGKNDKAEAGKTTAGSIILVGEEAIVDGLAAAPLANATDAPILLTKKDSIPDATMTEIKRLVDKGVKIYLVGGENNISKEVQKQLVSEMNAEIVRLSGDDRFETSLEIAKELRVQKKADFDKHFVVGGDGLSDAMSIASIAAKEKAPVIVSPAAGLTKDAKKFLADHKAVATVVGGESKVSTQVLKDIKAATTQDVTRISGDDRHETNANVIKTLAEKSVKNVYAAKSGYVPQNGDALLVDALAVAPLAAKTDGTIVLATDEVSKAQENAVKKVMKDDKSTKLTQVGGGVNANIIQKLVKILGL